MSKMKAAIRRRYGPPQAIQIETTKIPTPKANEVLVKVAATTVNRTDCANLTAKPFIMRFVLGFFFPKKIILGTDFAGEIVAAGKDVTTFKVGDKVFGFKDTGLESQAEYLTTSEENLLAMPDGINYQQAAASVEGAHYAYTFIHKTHIQSGQKVFINGATGAIGSSLLQFVAQYNVEITATCSTENTKMIQSLGADKTYDYTKEDFTRSTEKYDFIFDTVGKSTFGKCKPLLNKHGVYISSELGPYAQNIFFALFTPFSSNQKVIFPVPYSTEKSMPYISDLLEKGKFKPLIDCEYALENIADAYEFVMRGEKTGNVVINLH